MPGTLLKGFLQQEESSPLLNSYYLLKFDIVEEHSYSGFRLPNSYRQAGNLDLMLSGSSSSKSSRK